VGGLIVADENLSPLAEAIFPEGYGAGAIEPPILRPEGWYFYHRGESQRLGDTLVLVRMEPRFRTLTTTDLRDHLERQRRLQQGTEPRFDSLVFRALGTYPTSRVLLLDPAQLCKGCVQDLLIAISNLDSLQVSLVLSFKPELFNEDMLAVLARVAARHGAPADSSGALSDHFLPGNGSAWLYYPSRAKGRWLRAEVPIHRVLPALSGHWLPPLEP
jgi:hypothetical protein